MLLNNIVDIRNPDMTKNISTPINPDGSAVGNAWKIKTDSTAIALRPSMSGRYFIWDGISVGFTFASDNSVVCELFGRHCSEIMP